MIEEDTDKTSLSSFNDLSPLKKNSNSLTVSKPRGLFPLPSQVTVAGSAAGNHINKVALQKGYSLMDWVRLTKSGKDLSGTNGRLFNVTPKELKSHNQINDAWMAINGKVFNVTPYMKYHPGGDNELMKGVGKDATQLFNDVHRWVNYGSMLQACLIGKLIDEKSVLTRALSKTSLAPPEPAVKLTSTVDTYQTDSSFVISVYPRWKDLTSDNIIVEKVSGKEEIVNIILKPPRESAVFGVSLQLGGEIVETEANVSVGKMSGKVEVILMKKYEERWNSIPRNYIKTILEFRPWILKSRERVTHDVDHVVLEPPSGLLHFRVPIGHHVVIRANVAEEVEIERSYTPVEEEENNNSSSLHLLIKTYPNGTLTPYLKGLKQGSEVFVSDHQGNFEVSALDGYGELICFAAGTGFTPMVKLASICLARRKKVKLLIFNKTKEDIIWRERIEKLALENEGNFTVHHILSQEPMWFPSGRISEELLCDLLGDHNSNSYACICGPIPFTMETKRILKEAFGYKDTQIYLFK